MIDRSSLSDRVYKQIRSDILNQRIGFGEQLINRELRERFGVSSTPIRDAINRLYHEGLVSEITNVGVRVISFNARMALEVNEVISALNQEAARLSLARDNHTALVPILEQCIENQMNTIGSEEYFLFDSAFHQAFFDFSGNEFLGKIYQQHNSLWELLVSYFYKDKLSNRTKSVEMHKQILSAYKNNDLVSLLSSINGHFKSAVEPLTKINVAQDNSA